MRKDYKIFRFEKTGSKLLEICQFREYILKRTSTIVRVYTVQEDD